jgi:hypothetical protein
VVGASCTLNISFKHTTGDYLDAEHLLKGKQNFKGKDSMEQTQKKQKSSLNKNENFTGSSVTQCNMYVNDMQHVSAMQCNLTFVKTDLGVCNETISEDV